MLALAAVLAVVSAGLVAVDAVQVQPAVADGSSCGPSINPIVCENQKPGTDPSVWDIDGAGDPTIQGFATDISVNAGSKIDFKVDTDAAAYTIDIYRIGWYQGDGARYIQSVPVTATLPQTQPQCISDVATELYDCGTWNVSASWNVPADTVSGVYIAKLTRGDTGGASHIIFIVRNDGNHSDVVFQTSDATWEAYNTYGGADFYQGGPNNRAYKLSYNRPFATRNSTDMSSPSGDTQRDFFFDSEYPTVRFLERNGYDVSYLTDVDSDRYGSELLNHKVFLSVGHDEYWSAAQRKNVEAARDAGVNLQFLSGNEIYWHTRYEPSSADGTSTDYRTIVTYKETWGNPANPMGGKIDDSTPEWTGTWRDPRFATQAEGAGLPENALSGTIYTVNDTNSPITVSANEGKLRLWRNTSLTSLAAGTSATFAPGLIGYESDEDIDNGFRPAGLIRLSSSTVSSNSITIDYGNTTVAGESEHHLTLYRAASGALVFSAGTIRWGWGLDNEHDGTGQAADPRIQQAEVNMLADMGVQPATLMSGLVAAAKSTDTVAPTATITSPAAGTTIANGTSVTVTGTASDVGGVVAGVEVSTDGGTTWHPATGTTAWTYTYIQQGTDSASITARAIDDSGNFSTTGTKIALGVKGPFSAFGNATPTIPATDDSAAVELGLQFTPAVNGFVSGVRFYKGTGNTGTHVGSLWDTTTGQRLAQVTFTGESATGWQTAQFADAVPVDGGHKYTVSYSAPNGMYASSTIYWPYNARPSTPVTVASGVGAAAPGVYGSIGQMPTDTYRETNYYVDALFELTDSAPLRLMATSPVAGATSVPATSALTATISRSVVASSVAFVVKDAAGSTVAGTTSYDDTTRTATFTPSAALASQTTYTATVTAQDSAGVGFNGANSWSFTTAVTYPDSACPCQLFSDSTVPGIASVPDSAVTLGVRFTPTQAGSITALRFYKGTGNTGTHTGALWSAGGTQLASVTFTGESAQGWQTATLSKPVAVSAGTQYVASYTAPNGGYSYTAGQFTSPYVNGPLTVPANGALFTYTGGMPSQASSGGYGVDVVFRLGTLSPTLQTTTPGAGATNVAVGSTITGTFDLPVSTATIAVTTGGSTVAGTVAWSTDKTRFTFTPASDLPAGAIIAVAVTAVTSSDGTAGHDASWSFQTQANGTQATTVFQGADPVGATTATDDSASVILGMKFTVSVPGSVTGIRFYKAATNTGTHTGWLWGADSSTPLATVTFTGETTSGWQRAALSTPVALATGQVYTVSYLAPRGNYTYTGGGFSSPITNNGLTGIATGNGVYLYGSSGKPTSSYNATNYYVDVEFTPDTAGSAYSQTLWDSSVVPQEPSVSETSPVELGTAFTVDEPGEVSAIRFYKGSGNTGTHVGNLWSSDGTKLASVTFTGETASGWQQADLATPVAVAPGTTYVVSYFAPNGGYAKQLSYFTTARVSGHITGIANQNGRYLYSATGGFPTQSYQSAAYFVDVEVTFSASGSSPSPSPSPSPSTSPSPSPSPSTSPSPDPAPASTTTVTQTSPTAGAVDVSPTTTVTATFDADPGSAALALADSKGVSVGGAALYDAASKTVIFTPDNPLGWSTVYKATVSVADGSMSPVSWTFTTTAEPTEQTVATMFGNAIPTNPWWDDTNKAQVATRFSVDVAGQVTGVRFYKGSTNTGQHTGYLWKADGTKLAEVQFMSETADGWQTAQLASPVDLVPGVEYRVGLYSTTGRYAVDLGTLASQTTVGPFTIPAQGGAWIYSTNFPSNVSTNNYWVDVLYTPAQ